MAVTHARERFARKTHVAGEHDVTERRAARDESRAWPDVNGAGRRIEARDVRSASVRRDPQSLALAHRELMDPGVRPDDAA